MSGRTASIIHWTNDLVRALQGGSAERLLGLEPAPQAIEIPEIDIVAFAGDSVLSGRIQLPGERVSDVLNDSTAFAVTDALLEDLVDGHAIEVPALLLRRDEVFVVEATGPRGNAARRHRTCQSPVVAKAGPYEVFGYVHTLPGSPPLGSFRSRRPMVPITDAVIGFTIGSRPYLRRCDVVMLNHQRVEWIVEAPNDALMLEMPAGPSGPLAKDFTGYLQM